MANAEFTELVTTFDVQFDTVVTGAVYSVNNLVGHVIVDGKNIYVDNDASQKELLKDAILRIQTPITNSEIDALFN